MCLITEQPEPLIAEQDITCYKMLSQDRSNIHYNPGHFRYDNGILYKTELSESTDDENMWKAHDHEERHEWLETRNGKKLYCIAGGFHSFSRKNRIEEYSWDYDFEDGCNGQLIFQCTIPKGSLYYPSITGLLVSNQIVALDRECSNLIATTEYNRRESKRVTARRIASGKLPKTKTTKAQYEATQNLLIEPLTNVSIDSDTFAREMK